MITIRKSQDRGHFDFGWLNTYHTFSFGDYFDPKHHHYRALRVINDDRIAGGGGFPTHPHRDMEILSYMLAGKLAHRDSLGHTQEIGRHEWQVMSAGTGIEHSEFNPSATEMAHLLQIWIVPERKGLPPRYGQKLFESQRGRWQVVASPDGRDGSLVVQQDVIVMNAHLQSGDMLTYTPTAGRGLWLHVATGAATVNGTKLVAGDAAAIEEEANVTVIGNAAGEVLLIDLA